MEIRVASPDDCKAVATVHVASWQAAYAGILDPAFLGGLSIERREQAWRNVLSAEESELLLGCAGSSVIGFASFGPSRDADAPPGRGELWALYVRPESWSSGAGRELWHAVRGRLQSRGFPSVSLWVLERNARAIRFYSLAGFSVEPGSEREFELGGTKVREVRMVHAI
jgi:ribosomal protein S18 acetylase RimI-like enzyme